MAVTILEDVKSRNFSINAKGGTMPTRWVCIGSDDEIEVYNAIRFNTPSYTTGGLIRTNIGAADFRGSGLCYVEVMYGSGEGSPNNNVPVGDPLGPADDAAPSPSPGSPDDPMTANCSFTTSGGTAHITQSLQTRSRTRATSLGGGNAIDNKRAIGLKRDGVEGCEKIIPKMEWTVQRDYFAVTYRQMRNWMTLTGKVNAGVWFGFKIGEVIFLGAEGQGAGVGRWTVTFKFAFNEDQPDGDDRNIIVAGDLQVPSKRGWEYVWTAYKDVITGAEIYPLPIAAYVERIYEFANFADIGIGV